MPNRAIIARYRLASVVLAAIAFLSGLTVLLGWILGNEMLKGGFIADITMKANTSVLLLLTGAAVLLLHAERRSAWRTWLGRILASIVAVVGILTLSEHLFGVDLGIDQILFPESAGAQATISPNRMGPPAASCFTLLGIALLFLDYRGRRGRVPFQLLALIAMAMPAPSLIGYLYNARQLYAISGVTGISLQTSVSLFLLGAATLLTRPEDGFMRRLSGADSGSLLVRRLLPWAFALPVAITMLRLAGERLGIYDADIGRALSSLTFMTAFAALIWWTGGIVSRQERAAEETRTEIQTRLVQSLETMNDAFLACDSTWRLTYVNASAERISGESREEVLGKVLWEAFPNLLGTDAERHLRRALQERAPGKFEILYEPFGRHFESEVLPTSDGGVAIYARDVTDRRRALDVLEDADRRKNRFLATLAHELRNPLAPVRNAVQLLRMKGNPEPDVAWAHAVIDRQVDHLTRLIEDLMDVSRISYGKLELRKDRVTLEDIIAGAIESSRPAIESNRHHLVVKVPEERMVLDADSVRLAQVFMNLLTNAAKYTPGGGEITLAAERQGSDVVVSVSDTGMGLTQEQLPRLFEMFFQTEEQVQKTQGGLGIGLALVRHLVELHGGTVTAESPGRGLGSTFRVRLPLAADQAMGRVAATDATTPARLRGRRVLVVDDNRDATLSMVRLLELAGATTRRAFDGEEAMKLIDLQEFDIALLDIGLPKVNGHDLARTIRAREWGKRATLVALTGWGANGDRDLSRDAGFDHHLVKPVSVESLLNLLSGNAATK